MKKSLSILVCVAVMVAALFPLSQTQRILSGPAHETPVYGGSVTIARYEDTVTFNPILAPGITSLETCGLLFDGLMRLDENGLPKVALATNYTVSPDGKTYTFTLRQNVQFHDGVELTSKDVKFTFDQAVFNTSISFIYRSYYKPLNNVEIVDNYTVAFHLNNVSGPFMSWMNLPIIPEHIFNVTGSVDIAKDSHNFNPIGTGAFKFREWAKDDHLVLEAFQNHYDGRPYLDQVIFRVIPDPATMAVALENGEVDFARDISLADTVRLAVEGPAKNVTVLVGQPNYIIGLRTCFQNQYFNKTNPNSLKLREAIGYSIDRDGISRSIYYGLASVAHSPLPIAYPFWNNEIMGTGKFQYNQTKANEILDSIYPRGTDGFRITLELAGASADRDYLELVKTQLERVGIKINLWIAEKSAFWAHTLQPYDLATWTWVAVPDPAWVSVAFASWTTSAYTKTASGKLTDAGNYWSSGNATLVDDLLRQGEGEPSPDARQAIYHRLQEVIGFEDPMILFTNFKPWPHAYNNDLRGITAVPMMLYETTLSNSLPNVWLASMTPPPEQYGSIFVKGYDNLTMVPFTAWYDGPNGTSAHVDVLSTGYMWANLQQGAYTVYSIYNGTTTTKGIQVVANQTAEATFVFAGPAPPSTSPQGFPILEVGVTAVAVAIVASGVTYFATKRRSRTKE